MAYREFTDQWGVQWKAWFVAPTTAERRLPGVRRVRSPREPGDRRTAAPHARRGLRLTVLEEMRRGWLCFQSDGEKRRLAPVPPAWATMSDAVLAELCAHAIVACGSARVAMARAAAPRRTPPYTSTSGASSQRRFESLAPGGPSGRGAPFRRRSTRPSSG